MRGDLLLLLATLLPSCVSHAFLLRYAGLAAEYPLLKFSIQATGWLTKPWQKSISIRRGNRLVLPAFRFSGVLPCLHRHYFHLAGAVHQQ